ncbi:MAG TPA: carboxypeptidase regulatory-like domain-containing protein, partial [Kofleriaceae bacterium]
EERSTVAVTDASGAWSASAIAPGGYKVTASAVGFLPGSTDKLSIAAGEHKDHIDLALAAGGTTVSGTVTDVGSGPIAGARVTLAGAGRRLSGTPSAEVNALTRDDGSYKLTVSDGEWVASATHDDYTRGIKLLRVAGAPQVIDFVLTPGAIIRGQVVAKNGAPVPGAEVSSRSAQRMLDSLGRATADAEGKFTLKGIGSGAISLSASARGYASTNPTTITVGVGEQLENVKLIVDRAFSISGTIVDRATRKGIAGVRVQATTMPRGNSAGAEPTAADGAFEVPGVGRGNYLLLAMGDGVMPEFNRSAEVVDKDVTGIVIEMSTGVHLSGRVEPPVAASIRLEPDMDKLVFANPMNAAKLFGVTGESDPATGAFVLDNVPAGSFSLVATQADGRTGKLAVTVADQDQANLVVALEPRASIAGKVVDAGGAAVSGVRVAADAPAPSGPGLGMLKLPGFTDGVVTGSDGSFKIVGLDAGKLEMTVRDDHGKLAPARGDKLADVELARGQELTGVVLTVESRDGKITGRVIGSDGKPAADAWVTATYQASSDAIEVRLARILGGNPPALTSADGRFALDHLRHGRYKLVVDGPRGGSRAEATANAGDTVAITLAVLATLSGRATANGSPVKVYDLDCHIADAKGLPIISGEDAFEQHVSTDDGSYTADHIAPGTYECAITSDAGTAKDTIAIASEPVHHDFALVAFASVTGTAVDAATGKPLAGVSVLNMQRGNPKAFTAMMSGSGPKTDASGHFELVNQPLGNGRLMILDGQRPLMPAPGSSLTFTLTAGQHLDLGTIKLTSMMPPGLGGAGSGSSH